MRWIPSCASHWTTFPSVSSPFLPLQFFYTWIVLGQKFWLWVSNPVPLLEALDIYWRWVLWVPSSQCWACWLRSPPLSPYNLLPPGSLVLSRGSSYSHLPPMLLISIHSLGPLGFSLIGPPPYLMLVPFPLPLPSAIQVSPSLCLQWLFSFVF